MVNNENAILRRIVASYLDSKAHRHQLYYLDDVVNQFSIAADVSGNAEIKCDVSKVVRAAFAELAGGSGDYEYDMSYEDIGSTSQYCLYIKRSRPARGQP